MYKLTKLRINGLYKDIMIDEYLFNVDFSIEAKVNCAPFPKVDIFFNNKIYHLQDNKIVINDGDLSPFSTYQLTIKVYDLEKVVDQRSIDIHTGKLFSSFIAKWISDDQYVFKEKKVSPKVLTFKKELNISKNIKKAVIYASALGLYDIYINNKKVTDAYFLPGFTSYKNQIQYERFDVTSYLKTNNIIEIPVAGGWAVGSYVFTRVNRVTTDKQALFLQMHIEYEDGSKQIIISDESWDVSHDSKFLMCDLYDGEHYDARRDHIGNNYHKASITKLKFVPNLLAHYGTYNRIIGTLKPVLINTIDDSLIYDFKQNHAGLLTLKIKNASEGDVITIHHAEILNSKGRLNRSFLRSAKQEIVYICKKGEQIYTPTFTYMGFRYIEVTGISKDNIEIISNVISADIAQIGSFSCSNELINKLQENICWSTRSNFIEIPTDCPQRDERMGWTGDINVFAPTALFNYDAQAFLKKWLKDLRSEQLKSGGIPNTIPSQGYGFPTTMPKMAVDFWGDVAVSLPYNLYRYYGDLAILEQSYTSMQKYVKASLFWAKLFSLGKNRYIWNTFSLFHFGDWIAPDVEKMSAWQKRSKYTATCSLRYTSLLTSKVASILNRNEDAKKYEDISNRVKDAFINKLTDGNGKTKEEFQTGYVLPLYYDMFSDKKKEAESNFLRLIKKDEYKIMTGFPGTPYILFSLFDNGYEIEAIKMLLNEKCPSWLHEVKAGATTIWERWNGLDENGQCPVKEDGTGGMISYNHYASGAVGDFLYKRIAGISELEPGYKKILFKPYINKQYFTSVSAYTTSIYGKISLNYQIKNNKISIEIDVPLNCKGVLQVGEKTFEVDNGHYKYTLEI